MPTPLPIYLQRANNVPQPLPQSQPLLLVLDLNGTLLHRPNRKNPGKFIARPYTDIFLQYVLKNFYVMIWSSARPENVNLMCNVLFSEVDRQKVIAEWGRDRLGLSQSDYNNKSPVYKMLGQVWGDADIAARHPLAASGWVWGQSNTVLIDDTSDKAKSEPHNLIELPEFNGDMENQKNALSAVIEYLDILKGQKNVSAYIRAHPFRV